MNLRPLLRVCGIALVATAAAHGQIDASLALGKKQYMSGEAVVGTLTLTNHTGTDVALVGDGRQPWLDFVIKKANGDPATATRAINFPSGRLAAGQTIAREVSLSSYFNVSDVGNYSVFATIRLPGESRAAYSSNRLLFTIANGRPYWTQKVGVPGNSMKTREYRIFNYASEQRTQLFLQILDGRTGMPIQTYPVGDVMAFRKPQITVDKNQNLHVFFLSSPTIWTHTEIDTEGKLVHRELFQRGGNTDPALMTQPNGVVFVTNGNLYDPEALQREREKIRKASDRPVIQPLR